MSDRPVPREPVQQPGESWLAFYDRWAASRYGSIRRSEADRLNNILRPIHAAEKAGKFLAAPYPY